MSFALRAYQSAAVDRVLGLIHRQPILVAPTGSGKTVMGVEIAQRIGRRVLWVAHRRELIQQAAEAVRRAGGRAGIILAGETPDPGARFQVASVQTLARREIPDADLLVIDEAHHATSSGYSSLIGRFPLRLGLTATPFRLDGKGLGDAGFHEIVVAAFTDDLCADGTLHEPLVFAAPPPDLRAVKKTAGDYNLAQLGRAVRDAALDGPIVATWLKRAAGRRTVAFAVDIDHAESIAAEFLDHGISAEVVTGTTPKTERAGVLARLAHGVTLVVVNVGVLTEGWDLPALECAIIARPTASLCLHLQQIGRVMRACEGKNGAVVLDHAGNTHAHGLVTERLAYSLDGKVKKANGEAPTKTCPECSRTVAAGVHVCPSCGYAFPAKDRVSENDVELLPIGHADPFEVRARRWDRMYEEGQRISRWKNGGDSLFDPAITERGEAIAASKYKARYGDWPIHVGRRLIDPSKATPSDRAELRQCWSRIGARKGWDGRKVAWFIQKQESEVFAKAKATA